MSPPGAPRSRQPHPGDGLALPHPFPGPGLAIRILGEVTEDRLEILREADAIFIEEIKRAGLYREIWQAFAALAAGIQSVGAMGDARTYAHPIIIRAVTSGLVVENLTAQLGEFFGVPGVNETELEAHILKVRVDRDLTENLKLMTTVIYGNYDKVYTNVFPNSSYRAFDDSVALDAYTDPTRRENLIAQ